MALEIRPYLEPWGESGAEGTSFDNPLVRGSLRQHALDQALRAVAAIELGQPPAPLAAVDRETDRLASRRVANMLRAFTRFLDRGGLFEASAGIAKEILAAIHDPILRDGQARLTSPALLVIQALLLSHSQWYRTHHHEAHSAWVAYQLLGPTVDERDRRFVAALVAHQTLLRVAWNLRQVADTRPEVAAFHESGKLLPASGSGQAGRQVAMAIGRTLFPFLEGAPAGPGEGSPRERARLVAALVLASLCLEFRHQNLDRKGPLQPALETRIEEQVARFAAWLASTPRKNPWRLIFWQYGHRVMARLQNVSWHDLFRTAVEREAAAGSNLTFCFDPHAPLGFWSQWNREARRRLKDPRFEAFRLDHGAGEAPVVAGLVSEVVGRTVVVGPSAAESLITALDLPGRQTDLRRSIERWIGGKMDALTALDHVREAVRAEHLGSFEQLRAKSGVGASGSPFAHGYFPAPLLGRILREMARLKPSDWSLLRLRPQDLPAGIAGTPFITGPITILLPGAKPGGRGKSRSSRRAADLDRQPTEVEVLVARYVAAMVNNLQVSLAPLRVDLDFFSSADRERWWPLIKAALLDNGHEGICLYLQQYRSEVCRSTAWEALDQVAWSRTLPDAVANRFLEATVLGIDIGAGSIKCGLFPLHTKDAKGGVELQLGPSFAPSLVIPTARPKGPYKDAQDFARWVVDLLATERPEWSRSVAAAGLAWPGAVRDQSRVGGSSGILRNFESLEGKSTDDPRRLHQLDFRTAFAAAFLERLKQPVLVTLLNDGDADVRGQSRAEPKTEGVSVVLKAGTGTACGVYVGGRLVPLLAELGKAVLNLQADPLAARLEKPRGFPEGTLNAFCSARTLPAVAAAKGWRAPDRTPALSSKEIGHFLEPDNKKKLTLAREIAQELVYARFADVFESPTTVEEAASGGVFDLMVPGRRSKALLRIGRARLDALNQSAAAVADARQGQRDHRHAARLARECADIAGRLLADAIAMLVNLLRCREVRLAGGPLSGATGELVTDRAKEILERLYGLEIRPIFPADPIPADEVDPHVLREPGLIRLVYPRPMEGHAGETGAARAAVEALVYETKRQALVAARDHLARLEVGKGVTLEELLGRVEDGNSPLVAGDLVLLIETFMASLGLTSEAPGCYRKVSPGRLGAGQRPATATRSGGQGSSSREPGASQAQPKVAKRSSSSSSTRTARPRGRKLGARKRGRPRPGKPRGK